MSATTLVSAEQLLEMADADHCELIEGELQQMTPTGWEHGVFVVRLTAALDSHVRKNKLGLVLTGEPGFTLARDPDTVRTPDVAFIRADRLAEAPKKGGFWPGPPDLAAEVLSPNDTIHKAHEKALAWLEAGTALVWVLNPAWRTVTVYRSPDDIQTLTDQAALEGGDLLPGFHCPIADLFATL